MILFFSFAGLGRGLTRDVEAVEAVDVTDAADLVDMLYFADAADLLDEVDLVNIPGILSSLLSLIEGLFAGRGCFFFMIFGVDEVDCFATISNSLPDMCGVKMKR